MMHLCVRMVLIKGSHAIKTDVQNSFKINLDALGYPQTASIIEKMHGSAM